MPRAVIDDEPAVDQMELRRVLEAVSDPIRLSIVVQLSEADEDITCGSFDLPIKASTATHHFTALRQAGLIHQYYRGTSRLNTLRADDVEEAFPGLLGSVVSAAQKQRPQ
jgi:DNA-binding transcriptional ArsR family regulator